MPSQKTHKRECGWWFLKSLATDGTLGSNSLRLFLNIYDANPKVKALDRDAMEMGLYLHDKFKM